MHDDLLSASVPSLNTGSFHQAIADEDVYTITTLLKSDVDVNEIGRNDRTPMHVCALLNDRVTAQALLHTGRVDLTLHDIHGRTPLQCALEVGHAKLACLLLDYGAKIEDVVGFILEMMDRMRRPVEEKVAHACLAWLWKHNDFRMTNDFINALVAGSGSSAGSIARFLEGTSFRDPYVEKTQRLGKA